MTATGKTPYEILGVPENIDYGELRIIYRTKIHEHKQKKISPINFRHICRAYETLSDFDKRKEYDAHKQWISELPIDKYTPQQLAAEPDLIRDLKKRFRKTTLAEINAQDLVTGHTTLYVASRAGNLEAVKFLTDRGAEPDLSQRTKSTALHVASFYGHADIVRHLLESGADYRIINSKGYTAETEAFKNDVNNVFYKVKQNDYVRVAANELEWFRTKGLEEHPDTDYFTQRQTLLHCASKKGYFDLVRWLVEQKKANIDLVDFNDNSALHLAAYGGHTDIVKYLLERGCDPTRKNRWGTTAEEEGTKHGRKITDLFEAMREHDMFEMARNGTAWWFYYYFDNESKDLVDDKGVSLLYYACRYGRYAVAKWLLEHGANVNIQMLSEPNSTALHGAKYHGHLSIVELLLESKADVNIKNHFQVTVFGEETHEGVNQQIKDKINHLLQQYKCNLNNEKLLDVHVYDDDSDGEDPVAKLKLGIEAGYDDLRAALSRVSGNQYPYFSVARRPLHFLKDDPSIISAVCRARYACSKFIETPLCLTRHKTKLSKHQSEQLISHGSETKFRPFHQHLLGLGKTTALSLKTSTDRENSITIGDLMFTFSDNCVTDDIDLKIKTIFPPECQTFNLPGCICVFKIDIGQNRSKLIKLPTVSMIHDHNALLYTLATPTPYWFISDVRINSIHAFVRRVEIIPGHLTLPPDMFIAAALGEPLTGRISPVGCNCLTLREQNSKIYPRIAYHGTNINAVRSILLDGLVTPGTIVSSGKRITPPPLHIPRGRKVFGTINFPDAVFLSPSIHYSSDSAYAISFTHGDQQLIPVLECSVKRGSYKTYRSTVRTYIPHAGDDLSAIEWRVKDPTNVEINSILFITKINSIAESKDERIAEITSPSQCTIL